MLLEDLWRDAVELHGTPVQRGEPGEINLEILLFTTWVEDLYPEAGRPYQRIDVASELGPAEVQHVITTLFVCGLPYDRPLLIDLEHERINLCRTRHQVDGERALALEEPPEDGTGLCPGRDLAGNGARLGNGVIRQDPIERVGQDIDHLFRIRSFLCVRKACRDQQRRKYYWPVHTG